MLASVITPFYTTLATLTANMYYTFKVESRNAIGYSTSFSNEVTILAASVPDAPLSLANNLFITASGIISLTWTEGLNNGGSPVIDYQVS